MYRIIVMCHGHKNIENIPNKNDAIERFKDLKILKKLYNSSSFIYFEELINARKNEYQVHKIG